MMTPYKDNPEFSVALANYQRYVSLKNALEIVDVYAMNSCDPDQYDELDKIGKYLREMYFVEDPTSKLSIAA